MATIQDAFRAFVGARADAETRATQQAQAIAQANAVREQLAQAQQRIELERQRLEAEDIFRRGQLSVENRRTTTAEMDAAIRARIADNSIAIANAQEGRTAKRFGSELPIFEQMAGQTLQNQLAVNAYESAKTPEQKAALYGEMTDSQKQIVNSRKLLGMVTEGKIQLTPLQFEYARLTAQNNGLGAQITNRGYLARLGDKDAAQGERDETERIVADGLVVRRLMKDAEKDPRAPAVPAVPAGQSGIISSAMTQRYAALQASPTGVPSVAAAPSASGRNLTKAELVTNPALLKQGQLDEINQELAGLSPFARTRREELMQERRLLQRQ